MGLEKTDKIKMYSKELYDLLEEVTSKKKKINRLSTHPLYPILLKETSFVQGLHSKAKGTQRLWHVKNNTKSVDVTAGELYQATLNREKKIKELGYQLSTIWEHKYNATEKTNRRSQDGAD